MTDEIIDWRSIPKQALVDALRNTSLGPTNLSRQDKADLVQIAQEGLRSNKAETLRRNLIIETAYQREKNPTKRRG